MRKSYLLLIIIGVLLLTAIITNPNESVHKETIKSALHTYLQKSADKSLSGTGEALGMMLGGVMVDRMVDSFVSRDNYFLFSTTKINWHGESRVVGVGLFGNVFLSDRINDALNQEMDETNK